MSSCEKCWADAGGNARRYDEMLAARIHGKCTPEEQAGPGAGECPACKRMTLHPHTGEPMCHCATVQIAWSTQRAQRR